MTSDTRISRRRLLVASAGLASAAAFPRRVAAQQYPSRPLRLILGFPPGGGTDAFARLLAPSLSEKFGQPVIVENKTGANGNLATEYVAKSAADGYTLLISTSSAMVAAPHAFKNMPVDPIKDLTHISMCTESDFCIVSNPGLPAKTFDEFVALAKREPGKIIHAAPGIGSVNQIGGELLAIRTGISLKTAQYRGSGPIITDMLADQVNMTVMSVGLAEPYVSSGRLNALLVMSKERAPQLPNVPSSVELGIKDLDQVTFWVGLHAPKKTPDPIISRLHATLVEALAGNALRDRMITTGLKPVGSAPPAFMARLDSDLKLYGEIFRAANIQPE